MKQLFTGNDLGTTHAHPPLCVKLPIEIDTAIRGAKGDRSARLRRWIVAGALAEGLISEEQAQPFVEDE